MDRDAFRPGPLADVAREPTGDRWTLIFLRELRHPPERVWAALTRPDQLGEWAPYTADRDLGGPGDAVLTMIDGSNAERLDVRVTRADRPAVLEYSWGSDLLRWELAGTASGTRLTLRHTMADRDVVAKVAAGWHLCLDVAGHLLDGDPVGPIRGSEAHDFGWQDLADRYAERFGDTGGRGASER